MSVYISNLPLYTGNTYNGYVIWNDSGETTTYKTLYQPQLVAGTGTDSLRTSNAGPVTGQDSIAIGANGGASAQNSINIGGSDGTTEFRTIIIGNNPSIGGANSIIVGNGSYSSGNAIVLGNETAAYANCIVIGNGIDANRATGNFAITVGTNNVQNLGASSVILGSNNRLGNFIYDGQSYNNGGEYNFILSNNSRLGFTGSTNYTGNTIVGGNSNIIISEGSRNSIFGGGGNVISGTTSGATLLGLDGYTPTRNDATFAMAYVMTNYASYNFADDTAAAAGGVVLGQIYHTSGALKIRIT
jgi:hypothetical protein